MAKAKKPFEEFDGVYSHSKTFPDAAIARIPESLKTAIDDGNEEFFSSLEHTLPKLYSAIVSTCGEIQLLELVSKESKIPGEEYRTYQWGLACDKRLVVCTIPYRPFDLYSSLVREDCLPCLPALLHGCYKKMDGMSIVQSLGPPGWDLPACGSHWRGLEDFCLDNDIDFSKTKAIRRKFKDDDIRVYIEGSQGDLILANYTKKLPILYHVKNNDFDGFKEIEDPQVLDSYFANAIMGFPECVDIT